MDVRKDGLVDHYLIRLACMANRVNGPFGRRPNGRDTHIDRIGPSARAAWEKPLSGAGGRGGARPDEAHHATLRAAGSDIVPTLIGGFIEAESTIIHKNARWLSPWVFQCWTRGIYPRTIVRK